MSAVASERMVRKAVFPVAGRGTRMLPITRAIPKEMVPVLDRPLIQFAVEEALAAGIREFIFVTDRPAPLLAAHFGAVSALEGVTETSLAGEQRDAARPLVPPDASLHVVLQEKPLGLGHAVWCARELVAGEPFAVLLPDDLMVPGALSGLVDTFHATGAAGVLAVEEVPIADARRYGMVAIEPDGAAERIVSIVEKPAPEEAPSNLAVVGRYVFAPALMELLGDTPPGAGGEIQLTDAVARLVDTDAVYVHRFGGERFDCGNLRGWLHANAELARAAGLPEPSTR